MYNRRTRELFMQRNVRDLLNLYNPNDPLDHAWTIPSPWYFDPGIHELEQHSVFAKTWQVVGRADQVRDKGSFLTADLAGEPIVVTLGDDGQLRAFYNVCRHHAAVVVTEAEGCAKQLRCPYHGWTYGNDGALKGMVEFEGVCNFDRAKNGLVPVKVDTWENFVFVNLDGRAAPLLEFLGKVPELAAPLQLKKKLKYFDRRVYTLHCNWKVYVDNYLDGGYHVPHAHKGLSSVIEYTKYTIENFERACLQSSPLSSDSKSESGVAATRQGRAFYLWIYPNFMINAYEGVMDTNLVLPLSVDKCAVVFDYYFADISKKAQRKSARRRRSHLRRRAARPRFPRVRCRPTLRAPRSRRAFVSSLAARRSDKSAKPASGRGLARGGKDRFFNKRRLLRGKHRQLSGGSRPRIVDPNFGGDRLQRETDPERRAKKFFRLRRMPAQQRCRKKCSHDRPDRRHRKSDRIAANHPLAVLGELAPKRMPQRFRKGDQKKSSKQGDRRFLIHAADCFSERHGQPGDAHDRAGGQKNPSRPAVNLRIFCPQAAHELQRPQHHEEQGRKNVRQHKPTFAGEMRVQIRGGILPRAQGAGLEENDGSARGDG